MAFDQLEGKFYEYMYHVGQADPSWNRSVLEFYVPHFLHCQRVLDIGCGEGQFIELLSAKGIEALGIDLDVRMVEVCRAKGLDVVKADLFDHLPQQKGRFDGIFSSNVVEHLPAQDALRFLQAAFEALQPGGILLVATPNPESLIVHLYEFWRDPTHVRLYSRWVLEFLFHYVGFREIVGGVNPRTAWELPSDLHDIQSHLRALAAKPRDLSYIPHIPYIPHISTISILDPPVVEGNRTLVQRLVFKLRRRLAQFLVRSVMFEELSALEYKLAFLENALVEEGRVLSEVSTAIERQTADSRAAIRALQDNISMLQDNISVLYPPREVFVKGVKPSG